MTPPFATCADCGKVCPTLIDFMKHCDAHEGTLRDPDWYAHSPVRYVNAQWSDADAVMVHVNQKTGDVRYPGRHDGKLKDGYERQYLRSLPEVNRFEREHGVANHTMHYDSNGRGLDDKIFGKTVNH